MKKFQKIFAVLFAVMLLLASCSGASTTHDPALPGSSLPDASASRQEGGNNQEQSFAMRLNNVSGKAGEKIVINLSMENNPSIAGYSVSVVYDPEVLTYQGCENQIKGGFSVQNSKTQGRVRVMCTVSGGNALSQNGVCDALTFVINDNAAKGSHEIRLIIADAQDTVYRLEGTSLPSVDCALYGCTLTVQ